MLIPLSWKAEELNKLQATKQYLSLSEIDRNTIDSIVKNGTGSSEEITIYNTAMTSLLMATREFSGSTVAIKEMFKAKLNPTIKDIPYEVLIDQCTQLILWVHAQLNWEMTESRQQILNATIDDFCSTLKKYNSTLTIQELRIAFDFGYQKKFGDFLNLSNATYFNWIREFTFCDERTKASKAILEAKENIINPPAEKLSPEEANEKIKLGTIRMWKEAIKGNEVFDAGNVTYDFIDGLKLIPFTGQRKMEIMAIAKQELIDEQKNKLQLMNKDNAMNHKTTKEFIDSLRKGIPAPTEKKPDNMAPHPSVLAHTKRLALKIYFKELIDSKVDFIELLDTAYTNWKNKTHEKI